MEDEPPREPTKRELAMTARATVELFGNGAVAKTRERLKELEAAGEEEAAIFWRALLRELERLHVKRHKF